MLTEKFPREILSHTPTPIEFLGNLTKRLNGAQIWIKRDDCTGLAFGGNKTRQLEYYFGEAKEQNADTILITGAVQSNYMRTAVAAARKLGMDVEVQLEERVPDRPDIYYKSGNPFLMKMMGAKIHHYPVGEDEEGADNALFERAATLKKAGKTPYVIPLAAKHPPLGSLGYVDCAEEVLNQLMEMDLNIDGIVLGTGSGTMHAGIIAGLRSLNCQIPVYGFCVRRDKAAQHERVLKKTRIVMEMLGRSEEIDDKDIWTDDFSLYPGYGQLNDYVMEAIKITAEEEGLIIDPVYSGKSMAGLIKLIREKHFSKMQNVLFLHSGGTPAIFGYPELTE